MSTSLFTGAMQRFSRWRSERRAIVALSQYPDSVLADIGLTRDGIRDAIRHGRSLRSTPADTAAD